MFTITISADNADEAVKAINGLFSTEGKARAGKSPYDIARALSGCKERPSAEKDGRKDSREAARSYLESSVSVVDQAKSGN